MQRKATAVWEGAIRTGKGRLTTDSGVLDSTAYSFSTRFENEKGTNPEELIAAAHAGCFAMALAAALGQAGLTPERLQVTAAVSLERIGEAWTISRSALSLAARIPGANKEAFEAAARGAKENCPVSRLLKAEITLDAKLEA
jgi:lipoyl-dependent peroxiredoxin